MCSRTVVVILSVRELSDSHASCHCSLDKWLLCNSCISSSIWSELFSKN